MDNLTPRTLGLVTRLSGREQLVPPPLNRAALEHTYREALTRWFELAALGPSADRDEVLRLYQELLRLTDEVGERRATHLRRQWAREWRDEISICPYCGERGPYHDPEREGEAANA